MASAIWKTAIFGQKVMHHLPNIIHFCKESWFGVMFRCSDKLSLLYSTKSCTKYKNLCIYTVQNVPHIQVLVLFSTKMTCIQGHFSTAVRNSLIVKLHTMTVSGQNTILSSLN